MSSFTVVNEESLWTEFDVRGKTVRLVKCPDLQGAVVLITGGAQGIGEAMVKAFALQGSRVFFCDSDGDRGRELQRTIGGAVQFQQLDLLKEAQIKRWIDGVAALCGEVNVLVNNAAIDPRIGLGDLSAADWENIFHTNVRACFLAARAAVPLMPPGRASIINFSSITFHIAPPEMAAYVASKGAILGFTRSLARELGANRIRVNAISPGWVMTERQLREHVTPAVKRRIRSSQCISDLIRPEEIAQVALFLASEASSSITGQEILADRGWAHS